MKLLQKFDTTFLRHIVFGHREPFRRGLRMWRIVRQTDGARTDRQNGL